MGDLLKLLLFRQICKKIVVFLSVQKKICTFASAICDVKSCYCNG